MRFAICPRNYNYKRWFAWYPIYWDYEGGRWVWLEFVYRKWDAHYGGWKVLAKEQYWRMTVPSTPVDAWDTSALKDKGNDVEKPPVMYSTKYGK